MVVFLIAAAAWDKRALDLIGHLCMTDKFHQLIHDEIVNECYRWKSPTYQEDDLNEDGTFRDWTPEIDPSDSANDPVDK